MFQYVIKAVGITVSWVLAMSDNTQPLRDQATAAYNACYRYFNGNYPNVLLLADSTVGSALRNTKRLIKQLLPGFFDPQVLRITHVHFPEQHCEGLGVDPTPESELFDSPSTGLVLYKQDPITGSDGEWLAGNTVGYLFLGMVAVYGAYRLLRFLSQYLSSASTPEIPKLETLDPQVVAGKRENYSPTISSWRPVKARKTKFRKPKTKKMPKTRAQSAGVEELRASQTSNPPDNGLNDAFTKLNELYQKIQNGTTKELHGLVLTQDNVKKQLNAILANIDVTEFLIKYAQIKNQISNLPQFSDNATTENIVDALEKHALAFINQRLAKMNYVVGAVTAPVSPLNRSYQSSSFFGHHSSQQTILVKISAVSEIENNLLQPTEVIGVGNISRSVCLASVTLRESNLTHNKNDLIANVLEVVIQAASFAVNHDNWKDLKLDGQDEYVALMYYFAKWHNGVFSSIQVANKSLALEGKFFADFKNDPLLSTEAKAVLEELAKTSRLALEKESDALDYLRLPELNQATKIGCAAAA